MKSIIFWLVITTVIATPASRTENDLRSVEDKLYRDDGRCGPRFTAPNGDLVSQCNPDGPGPCCSDRGWCGNTPNHCECKECVSYKKKAYREDGRCGFGFPAPDGNPKSQCDPNGDGPCCSLFGYCGSTKDYCECSGCVSYKSDEGDKDKDKPFRPDGRCGPNYPAPNDADKPGECNPAGPGPCCSRSGWCGSSKDHCECEGCVSYKKSAYRSDGRCGQWYPAPNGNPGECDPEGPGPCCSPSGWCGNSKDHCECNGCVIYEISESSESSENEGWWTWW